ncbi:hypothetical protein HPB52_010845 [Rhipicephalus sanguineus]|uniref:Uncharacterized protein n=1 Tax=Rhipicephalus sanguineus TaxID=34632 RepID=A0A9D4Q8S3_RHISA|nr:hypothetical protein HPB52_010845 [Rhipicephalus sanguineus]
MEERMPLMHTCPLGKAPANGLTPHTPAETLKTAQTYARSLTYKFVGNVADKTPGGPRLPPCLLLLSKEKPRGRSRSRSAMRTSNLAKSKPKATSCSRSRSRLRRMDADVDTFHPKSHSQYLNWKPKIPGNTAEHRPYKGGVGGDGLNRGSHYIKS